MGVARRSGKCHGRSVHAPVPRIGRIVNLMRFRMVALVLGLLPQPAIAQERGGE
jgi:hypothetical protein